MKAHPLIFMSVLALVSACSSPMERHQQRQEKAREHYNEDLKQSQEKYESDEMNVKRNQAKKMIDNSKSVEINEAEGTIKVKD